MTPRSRSSKQLMSQDDAANPGQLSAIAPPFARRPMAPPKPSPTERLLLELELTDAFSWSGDVGGRSDIGLALRNSTFFGPSETPRPWIFDHVPKTGGTHFGVLAKNRLHAFDHLWVRWPGSWNAITLGRLERASLVHGHGARHAMTLSPRRSWQTALALREPLSAAVSAYQQWIRGLELHGRSGPPLADWIDDQYRSRSPDRDLNMQVRWLGCERHPSVHEPFVDLEGPAALDDIFEIAMARLNEATLVADQESIEALFEKIARQAALRVLPPGHSFPIANASALPSAKLVAKLDDKRLTRLTALTEFDAALLAAASSHHGHLSTRSALGS